MFLSRDTLTTMVLCVDTQSFKKDIISKCHMLPCTIEYNGKAQVDKYFQSSVKYIDNSEYFYYTYF